MPSATGRSVADIIVQTITSGDINLPYTDEILNILHIQAEHDEDAKEEDDTLEGNSILRNITTLGAQAQHQVIRWVANALQINIIVASRTDHSRFIYYIHPDSTTNIYLYHTGAHYQVYIHNNNVPTSIETLKEVK